MIYIFITYENDSLSEKLKCTFFKHFIPPNLFIYPNFLLS